MQSNVIEMFQGRMPPTMAAAEPLSLVFSSRSLETAEITRPLKQGSTFLLEMDLKLPVAAYFNLPATEAAFRVRPVPGLALVDVRSRGNNTVIAEYKVVNPHLVTARQGAHMALGIFVVLGLIVVSIGVVAVSLSLLVSAVRGFGLFEVIEKVKEIAKPVADSLKWLAIAVITVIAVSGYREVKRGIGP